MQTPRLLPSFVALAISLGMPSAWADDGKLPAVVRSAQSGPWSAPRTWAGGKVPGTGARVLIREGHRVVYDVHSDQPIRGINVAGVLSLATDRNTRLDVGLIRIQAGDQYSEEGFDCDGHFESADAAKSRPALEVGTPAAPLPVRYTALIRLVYFPGMDKESCPAIVCCGGRMDFHGAPLARTWVKLGAAAAAGDTQVRLAEPAAGWRVGDRVIVTATGQGRVHNRNTLRPGAAPGNVQ